MRRTLPSRTGCELIREVESAHLVDAVDYLVEPVVLIQPRLAEQRRVDAVEVPVLVEELEPLHVPGDVAGVGHDLELLHLSDEALVLFCEISGVGER